MKQSIVLALICTIIIFVANLILPSQFNGFDSSLSFGESKGKGALYAEEAFEFRYHNTEFRKRPVVLKLQYWGKEYWGVSYQRSFLWINFFAFFGVFISLSRLAALINGEKNVSLIVAFFLLSFPVLFAFTGGIYTYDDIVQYLCVLLFLVLYHKEHYVLAALMFLLSVVVRETSFIYLIFIFIWGQLNEKKFPLYFGFLLLSTIPFYLVYLCVYLGGVGVRDVESFFFEERFFAWKNNFDSLQKSRETIAIVFMIIGMPLLLLVHKYQVTLNTKKRQEIVLYSSFIICNTLVVLIGGLVRESRLLLLPMLVVYPFVLKEIEEGVKALREVTSYKSWRVLLSSILFGMFMIFVIYDSSLKGMRYLYMSYLFVYSVLFYLLNVSFSMKRKI